MIGYEYTIELHDDSTGFDYEVDVEITHFYHQDPDYNTWDSSDDYYGFTEVEFDIIEIFRYDDTGSELKVNTLPSDLMGELDDIVDKLVLEDYEEEKRNGSY